MLLFAKMHKRNIIQFLLKILLFLPVVHSCRFLSQMKYEKKNLKIFASSKNIKTKNFKIDFNSFEMAYWH